MNRLRALLMGLAGAVGAGGIAAYNGVFTPTPTPPVQVVSANGTAAEPAKTEAAAPADAAKAEPAAPAATTEVAKADPNAAAPAAEVKPAVADAPAAAAAVAVPSFDVLRVEPDGSVLIAGKAAEGAQVEVLSGADVLGMSKAEMNGDFAITLTNPLKPGDYQLVLRATGADGKSATSVETATVSVPDKPNGEVLALVEEPGKASKIITAPAKSLEVAQAQETPAADKPASGADAEPAKPAAGTEVQSNASTAEVAVGGEVKAPAAAAETVAIEAVETEGGKIFVAGSAKGVAAVRIFMNDVALGDAKPGEGDRFLGEFQKDLAPGDYIVRAEGLAADGVTVISKASVPFQVQAPQAAEATKPASGEAAPAVAQAPAAAEPAKPKAVIIRRGDTLWQISRRVYGRGVRYSTIYLANQDVTQNPNRIFPGQVFKVPEKTPEGDAADPAEIEKRAAPADATQAQ